ncbi:MAG: hypothetical protein A2X42_09910 [Candidatus Margulisbacteria bacterium GWF2_38_17]|nr:MAG: hypothetical protein A2X42_09910 [Candidatus Margulisbacteria bacterium GWF2_38_17]
MVNRIDGSVNMNDTLYNAGLHRAPSLAQFIRKSMRSVNILTHCAIWIFRCFGRIINILV